MAGEKIEQFLYPAKFTQLKTEEWYSFDILVSEDSISATIGDESGQILGPLDNEGFNSIVLSPGGEIRHVELSFL